MSLTTPYKNPLKRNGTAQFERLIEALSPDGFKLDKRSLKDIMVASYRYASLLQYPNEQGEIAGDWTCFWEAETLTFLAVLCTIDTDDIAEGFAEIEKAGADENGKNHQNYLEAITYIRELALLIENYYQKLPDGVPLKREIAAIIRKNRITDAEQLEGALAKLIGWHKDAVNPEDLDKTLYLPFVGSANWGIANQTAFAEIDFDDAYARDDWQSLKQLAYQFLQALERIKSRACHWFDINLGTPQLQQPHIALFLTFLRLFQHTRDEMNGLTKRHLDFYYEKVLHLCRRPSQPDDVYLVFQLANKVDQHLIEQGTELLAGKKDGKPLIFETIEDWVLSGATVEQIKNAYLDTQAHLSQIYASPDVTAAYENGAVLENVPVDCFRTFGDDKHLPEGDIGFAISSPQLILREGKRIVDIVLEGVGFSNFQIDGFELSLSSLDSLFKPEFNGLTEDLLPLDNIGSSDNYSHPDTLKKGVYISGNIIRIVLDRDDPPVDIPEAPLEGGLKTVYPYVKITASSLARALNTNLTKVEINVKVFGVQETLIIESDEGVFDGTQKFLPFGNKPKIDNKFYVGSGEVFQKSLHCLDVNFDWIDPVDFEEHYAPYTNAGFSIPNPIIEVEKINQGKWEKLTQPIDQVTTIEGEVLGNTISGSISTLDGGPLIGVNILVQGTSTGTVTDYDGHFSLNIPEEEQPATLIFSYPGYGSLQVDTNPLTKVVNVVFLTEDEIASGGENIGNLPLVENQHLKVTQRFPNINHPRRAVAQKVDRLSTSLKRGFLRFQLKEDDFLHDEYQKVLVAYSAALSKNAAISEDNNGTVFVDASRELAFPLPPYTPTSNGIRVDYCSNQTMEFAGEYDHFYHILPWGYKKVEPENQNLPLLYNYAKNDRENERANGNLYLGLKDLKPGTSLSLLFRFKAGTEQDFDNLPPDEADFYWSYLAKNNQWLPFGVGAVLKNTTRGYTRTGIVQLKTPYNIHKENTLFKGDYHWIRLAAVESLNEEPKKTLRALPCLVSITAQAIEARSRIDANDPTHFVDPKPLAEQTIKRLAKSDSRVKKIEQPFPSFNGRMPEADHDFYQRVSERLSHRNRAVTVLDYERLTLERFPTVYRAKCLNHTQLRCEIAPGYVTLSVIPDIKQREVYPDFSPRFSLGDLREMAAFNRAKTNFFVTGNDGEDEYLKVVNPSYEAIRIRARIKFRAKVDTVFFSKKLAEALQFFIAPWALDEQADISFDRNISRSAIIQFIEQQEYVDAIKDLLVYRYANEVETEETSLIIKPTTSHSILTTALQHTLISV